MRRFQEKTMDNDSCVVNRKKKYADSPNHYFEDAELTRCKLVGVHTTTFDLSFPRSTVRNVRICDCSMNSFGGYGSVFDEVDIEGLLIGVSPAILDACVFRHVTIAGKCGRFLFNRRLTHDDEERNQQFQKLNDAFYAEVDWAIDISKINAACFEIRGTIPTRLIRRNPDEHFIMTRTVALSGDWKKYDPPGADMIRMSMFLDSGVDEDLFVAAKRSKNFKETIEFYHRLKAKGLVS